MQNIQEINQQGTLITENTSELILQYLETERTFVFQNINQITRWNTCPPDIMHDLCEGVLEDILLIFLNVMATSKKFAPTITNSVKFIISQFEAFPFYEGKPKLIWVKAQSEFKITGKAVQVKQQ